VNTVPELLVHFRYFMTCAAGGFVASSGSTPGVDIAVTVPETSLWMLLSWRTTAPVRASIEYRQPTGS
jgi:hypothetical protein